MSTKAAGTTYYGGFFWVAVVSFVVPLFVAFAAFEKVSPTTKPTPAPDVSGVDHNLWEYLLRKYVANGLVDYDGMSKDYLFTTYLQQIAGCDPSKLTTDADKLALHCNAYNAMVIDGVIRHKIHRDEKNVLAFVPETAAARLDELDDQIRKLKMRPQNDLSQIEKLQQEADQLRAASGFFRIEEHIFAGETISLDHLEQNMIRPVFQEPRIHVALVCAAKSCPAIRGEAYIGDRIWKQLQDQAIQFANNSTYVSYDAEKEVVQLSPILDWYSEDWDAQDGYLAWLQTLVKSDSLKEQLAAAQASKVKVAFNKYDWTLNVQGGGSSSGEPAGGGFGSGSVPNE